MPLNELQRDCTGPELVVADPIRGWRTWRIEDEGQLFGSTGRLWTPGTNTAACHGDHGVVLRVLDDMFAAEGIKIPDHQVEPWCTCGFYAHKSPNRATGIYDVGGVIEAWGRVLLGETGFRAQYAKIVALCGPTATAREHGLTHTSRDEDAVEAERVAVADRYGVPYHHTLNDLAHQYGEEVS